ncbi:MAG: hypothetical protein U5K31_03170 [Balneolaceae bacterium]|nr:hypothetical protein [Balneolaceae bacterium]
MSRLTIRELDGDLMDRLRIQAAQHGHSMEEEVRSILRAALAKEPEHTDNIVDAIRKRFAPLGGIELPVLPRKPMRKPDDIGFDP